MSTEAEREVTAISESVAPPLLSEKKEGGKPFEYATAVGNSTAEADRSLSQMTATLFPKDMTKRGPEKESFGSVLYYGSNREATIVVICEPVLALSVSPT